MPTKFPAAPRACVKRARVLRARATAAYIAKKKLTEKKRANFKKIYIYTKRLCSVYIIHILLLHTVALSQKKKKLLGENFDL